MQEQVKSKGNFASSVFLMVLTALLHKGPASRSSSRISCSAGLARRDMLSDWTRALSPRRIEREANLISDVLEY